MSYAEFVSWIFTLGTEDRQEVLAHLSDEECAALENWEP